MNSDLQHIINVILIVKNYLHTGVIDKTVQMHSDIYKTEYKFFDPIKTVKTIDEYIKELEARNLKDIKFLFNSKQDELKFIGFSNVIEGIAVTFYDSKTTCWHKYWEFDEGKKVWRVTYTECEYPNNQDKNLFNVEGRKEEFKSLLIELSDFTERVGEGCFSNFTDIFKSAIISLEDNTLEHSFLPIINNQHLTAGDKAWVFGGMGSWNDIPDLGDIDNAEYKRLSLELYREIMHAISFAVNEF